MHAVMAQPSTLDIGSARSPPRRCCPSHAAEGAADRALDAVDGPAMPPPHRRCPSSPPSLGGGRPWRVARSRAALGQPVPRGRWRPGNELGPLLPPAGPPARPTMTHPPLVLADRAAAPEPVRLAAALDAAGAAFVPTSQTVTGVARRIRATPQALAAGAVVVALIALALIAVGLVLRPFAGSPSVTGGEQARRKHLPSSTSTWHRLTPSNGCVGRGRQRLSTRTRSRDIDTGDRSQPVGDRVASSLT